ncbi:hypothetical protein GRX01_13980 [Halobaculum sp. WSA2]|uniref:Uncharacterized protein n=1 Tax=Halobaculum saliterrae TaxID=2073113 RepID=A0A6B0T0Y9_9EURY|nr:hypothetical protein [Halobaculum saliterrae]MXR42443.1 hypothetical protein [Halobaculum saliterrae]
MPRPLHTALRAAATARAALAVTAALLALVGLARFTPLPDEATVVAWPALAAAFLLDTALYNEAGVAVGDAGFWTLAVVGCYVEAVVVVAVARGVRRRVGSDR